MGVIQHNVIVVTGIDGINESNNAFSESYNKAVELFGSLVSSPIKSELNGYISFFIAPDGSKEYWPESDYANEKRKELYNFIKSFADEENESSPVDYVDMSYGEKGAIIETTNIYK